VSIGRVLPADSKSVPKRLWVQKRSRQRIEGVLIETASHASDRGGQKRGDAATRETMGVIRRDGSNKKKRKKSPARDAGVGWEHGMTVKAILE